MVIPPEVIQQQLDYEAKAAKEREAKVKRMKELLQARKDAEDAAKKAPAPVPLTQAPAPKQVGLVSPSDERVFRIRSRQRAQALDQIKQRTIERERQTQAEIAAHRQHEQAEEARLRQERDRSQMSLDQRMQESHERHQRLEAETRARHQAEEAAQLQAHEAEINAEVARHRKALDDHHAEQTRLADEMRRQHQQQIADATGQGAQQVAEMRARHEQEQHQFQRQQEDYRERLRQQIYDAQQRSIQQSAEINAPLEEGRQLIQEAERALTRMRADRTPESAQAYNDIMVRLAGANTALVGASQADRQRIEQLPRQLREARAEVTRRIQQIQQNAEREVQIAQQEPEQVLRARYTAAERQAHDYLQPRLLEAINAAQRASQGFNMTADIYNDIQRILEDIGEAPMTVRLANETDIRRLREHLDAIEDMILTEAIDDVTSNPLFKQAPRPARAQRMQLQQALDHRDQGNAPDSEVSQTNDTIERLAIEALDDPTATLEYPHEMAVDSFHNHQLILHAFQRAAAANRDLDPADVDAPDFLPTFLQRAQVPLVVPGLIDTIHGKINDVRAYLRNFQPHHAEIRQRHSQGLEPSLKARLEKAKTQEQVELDQLQLFRERAQQYIHQWRSVRPPAIVELALGTPEALDAKIRQRQAMRNFMHSRNGSPLEQDEAEMLRQHHPSVPHLHGQTPAEILAGDIQNFQPRHARLIHRATARRLAGILGHPIDSPYTEGLGLHLLPLWMDAGLEAYRHARDLDRDRERQEAATARLTQLIRERSAAIRQLQKQQEALTRRQDQTQEEQERINAEMIARNMQLRADIERRYREYEEQLQARQEEAIRNDAARVAQLAERQNQAAQGLIQAAAAQRQRDEQALQRLEQQRNQLQQTGGDPRVIADIATRITNEQAAARTRQINTLKQIPVLTTALTGDAQRLEPTRQTLLARIDTLARGPLTPAPATPARGGATPARGGATPQQPAPQNDQQEIAAITAAAAALNNQVQAAIQAGNAQRERERQAQLARQRAEQARLEMERQQREAENRRQQQLIAERGSYIVRMKVPVWTDMDSPYGRWQYPITLSALGIDVTSLRIFEGGLGGLPMPDGIVFTPRPEAVFLYRDAQGWFLVRTGRNMSWEAVPSMRGMFSSEIGRAMCIFTRVQINSL
jgi:hypothetical protein